MTASTGHAVRVTKLKIDKFRAISGTEIELGQTVALVGQNGAGKSSVLRALNAFFNFDQERAAFEAGWHRYSPTTQSVIEVTLAGLAASGLPTTSSGGDEVRARLKFKRQQKWECFVQGKWVAMPPNFHDVLRSHFSYALIPVRRDHEVAHDPASGLLERAVTEWIAHNRERDRTTPQIVQLATTLQTRSLAGLQRRLRKVAPLSGPFTFELGYSSPPDFRLLLQNLALTVREGGQSIPLSDSGSGTQSMAVFALYSYLAELDGTTFLLGLEEPEQNLHPQAQQQLMRSLSSLGLQVILTTHSPTIVDMLDHEHVVLCRRVQGKSRDLEVRITQIRSDFFAARGLDRVKYYKFHRRRNSDFLFADFVVVTESPIDAAVVEKVLEDAGVDPNELGMSFVPVDGVPSLPYMYYLLAELGIASAFVVDKDYFLPYKNNNVRDSSLDAHGYPMFGATPKPDSLLSELFPRASSREAVVTQLLTNHSEAMQTLRAVNFFCFRYAIEVDLVAAAEPRTRLYDAFRIQEGQRTEASLLSKKRALKSQEKLLTAVDLLDPRKLPNSFKALRRDLPVMAKAARAATE